MRHLMEQVRGGLRDLGTLGMAGVAVLAAAAALHFNAVQPLAERSVELEAELSRALARGRASDERMARDGAPAAKLQALYRYLGTNQQPTELLERINALAASSGVQLRSADYRLQDTGTRIERYEITLPLSGGYAQIRRFLEKSLEEIPVMSLDQVNFKRNRTADALVQAEAHVTLHLVKP